MSADLSNWRKAGHSAWSFRNIDRILPTNTITRTNANSLSLEWDLRTFDTFKIVNPGKSRKLDLQSFLNDTDTDGLILISKGKIILEHYGHGNNEASKHILMSMTKSIVGIIVGILNEKGEINVDSFVKDYIPWASGVFDGITIRDCLDMRSGVALLDDAQEYRGAIGWDPSSGSQSVNNLRKFIETLQYPAGASRDVFNYASINTDVLGFVIEAATGMKLSEVISDLLWEPMGAESEALITTDPSGNARAAGGMCATLRDVARLGRLLANGGGGIIPSTWIEDMFHGGSKQAFADGPWARGFRGLNDFPWPAYRSFWTTDEQTEILLALGIHGQHLIVDRPNQLIMAKLSSQSDPVDFSKIRLALHAFEEFRTKIK